ncbi:MAG: hypothetical protein CM1200mP2_21810 [Planctomycetaceae bacterium]|nr:MAG: hypothetical protein CM1200mP2_21810 [Planctomycetaceae bacterium]
MVRNAAIVRGVGANRAVETPGRLLDDDEPIVRGSAGLGTGGIGDAQPGRIATRRPVENMEDVQHEIDAAMRPHQRGVPSDE